MKTNKMYNKQSSIRQLIWILVLLTISACGSFSLQDELKLIAEDGVVTKEEYEKLKASLAMEDKFAAFRKDSALTAYMRKYYALKNLNVALPSGPAQRIAPFDVSVYFENSASMDGYIGQADLKSSVYDLLVNTKQFSRTLKLNYINSKVMAIASADIGAFSQTLTQKSFKAMGGKRGTSDIAAVIREVLNRTDASNASILISDFVFSPAAKTNAVSYLEMQEVAIKDAIMEQLHKQNLAIAIFQLEADFSGIYYDYKSKEIILHQVPRPYYIWFIGTVAQVSKALEKHIVSKTDNGLIRKAVFFKSDVPVMPRYKIVNIGRVGSFKFEKSDHISDVKALNGDFAFNIAVDFGASLKGQDYFSDPDIYRLNNSSYSLSVRKLSPPELNSAALAGYSHLITLRTKRPQSDQLLISVIDKVPQWVKDCSSLDDSAIRTDAAEKSRTFGLSHLLNGVYQAFGQSGNERKLNEIKIQIDK
ncbi:hypothetical protein ACTJKC_02325 [Pedobacter sp. 22226]|uniref:hypothetical protein n=1 Tax=Pedobacter sp. 22226 TaxID=3453894 RepID=UPI003F831434